MLAFGSPLSAQLNNVDPSSEAFRSANLRPGQVIIEIDRKPVDSAADVERIYREIRPGATFLVRVMQGEDRSILVTALTKPE